MKQFSMRHWVILSVVFILCPLIFLFYWFEYRPAQVRSDCRKSIDKHLKELNKAKNELLDSAIKYPKANFESLIDNFDKSYPSEKTTNQWYDECLQRHGLNK